MKIRCLPHVPLEDAANIGTWASLRGHALTYTHLYRNEPLPTMDSFDMLTIMGGPMNIDDHDEYPWLITEKDFIRQAIDAKKKIVGVCLGAQLLAAVLGGKVTANRQKEIGWHTFRLTPQAKQESIFASLPNEITVFHWHGDTFSVPPKATKLASSAACENQAFQYGDAVLGLQFHLEYSQDSIEKMLLNCSQELIDAPYIQTAEQIRAGYETIPQNTAWLYSLLDAFCGDR